MRILSPYAPTIRDEVSGTEVPNDKYKYFMEGAIAGYNQRSKEVEIAMGKMKELAQSLELRVYKKERKEQHIW